jgi:hypothetical protein
MEVNANRKISAAEKLYALLEVLQRNTNIFQKHSLRFLFYMIMCIYLGGAGVAVRIVSGYGLDDRAIEVRSSAMAKGFFV